MSPIAFNLLLYRETGSEIASFGKDLQLILRLPDTLNLWPEDTSRKKAPSVAHKIAIQDGSKFPTLLENVAHLDVGYFHKILVSILIIFIARSRRMSTAKLSTFP